MFLFTFPTFINNKNIKIINPKSIALLSVYQSENLQTFKVAPESRLSNKTVEVQQIQKLFFHLIEHLDMNTPKLRIESIFEVKVVVIFSSDDDSSYNQSMGVAICHVKILIWLLDPVDQDQGENENNRWSVNELKYS